MIQPRLSALQKQILQLLATAGENGLTLWDLKRRLYEVREAQIQRSVLNLQDHGLVRVYDWIRGDLERRTFRAVLTADGQDLVATLARPAPASSSA
jgi:hypothetical protein